MKRTIPKRVLSVFLALLMFLTTFPLGAVEALAANVASGQIAISNGKKYTMAWNYNYGKNSDGKIKIPEYSKAIANNDPSQGTTNLLRKYVSGDGLHGIHDAGKNEVPIYRITRTNGYTSDDSVAKSVNTITLDTQKQKAFLRALSEDGINLPKGEQAQIDRAETIYYILSNGFKQFTATSGDQFYREQLYFIATQCILWEIDENKRVGFGNDTKWTDATSSNYKSNASKKSRSAEIVGSYNKNISATYRYYWHDFYYTIKNKYFSSVKDCPDYYNEILESADMQKNNNEFQFKAFDGKWTAFKEQGSNYIQMRWNKSKARYEATYHVNDKYVGTGYGKYDTNKIVLPIKNKNGTDFTTTLTKNDVKLYSQATTNSKVSCTVDSTLRSQMKVKSGSSTPGLTVLGKTRNGQFYCVSFAYFENSANPRWVIKTGYIPVKNAPFKTAPSAPVMGVDVNGSQVTFYTSNRTNMKYTPLWNNNAPDIYNQATYFRNTGKNENLRGYLCGGRYDTTRVKFQVQTTAYKAYLRCSEDGELLNTISVAKGETVAGAYFNQQETAHPGSHDNYKYTYGFSRWSATQNGVKMENPTPSKKEIYGDTTFWLCLKKAENPKGRAVYYCSICGATIYDTSVSKTDKEHYVGEAYKIPTGANHVCSGGQMDGKKVTFVGWGQDSNADAKIAAGTLNDTLSVLSNHKAGGSAKVPSGTQKYYAKYTVENTNINRVRFVCSIDGTDIGTFQGSTGDSFTVPNGKTHIDSCNLGDKTYNGHPLSDYEITFSYWGVNDDYNSNGGSDKSGLGVGSSSVIPNQKETVYYAKYTFRLKTTVHFVCALCGQEISSQKAVAGLNVNAPSVSNHYCNEVVVGGISGEIKHNSTDPKNILTNGAVRTQFGWSTKSDNFDYSEKATAFKTPASGEVTYCVHWSFQNNITAYGTIGNTDQLLDIINNYRDNYENASMSEAEEGYEEWAAAKEDAKAQSEAAEAELNDWTTASTKWTMTVKDADGSNQYGAKSAAGSTNDYENSISSDLYTTNGDRPTKEVAISIPKSSGYRIVSVSIDDATMRNGQLVGVRTVEPTKDTGLYSITFQTDVATLKSSEIHVAFAKLDAAKVVLNYVALDQVTDFNDASITDSNTILKTKMLDWKAGDSFAFMDGTYEESDEDGNKTEIPYFQESIESNGEVYQYAEAFGYKDCFGVYEHEEISDEPDFTVDEVYGTLNVYLYYRLTSGKEGGITYNLFARGDEAVEGLDLAKHNTQLLLYRSQTLSTLPSNYNELTENLSKTCGTTLADYLGLQNHYAWVCPSCGQLVEDSTVCARHDPNVNLDDLTSVPEFWILPEHWICACGAVNDGPSCTNENCTETDQSYYGQHKNEAGKSWDCPSCGHENSGVVCTNKTYDLQLVKDVTAMLSSPAVNDLNNKEYLATCPGVDAGYNSYTYTGETVTMTRCSSCGRWFIGSGDEALAMSNSFSHKNKPYVLNDDGSLSTAALNYCSDSSRHADDTMTAYYVKTQKGDIKLISEKSASSWSCDICGTLNKPGTTHCSNVLYPEYTQVRLSPEELEQGYYYYFVVKDNTNDRYYYLDEVTGGTLRYTGNELEYNAECYLGEQLNKLVIYDKSDGERVPAEGASVMVLSNEKFDELSKLDDPSALSWVCTNCSYRICNWCGEHVPYYATGACPACGDQLDYVEDGQAIHSETVKASNRYNLLTCPVCGETNLDPDLQIYQTDEDGSILFSGDADSYKFMVLPDKDFRVGKNDKNITEYNAVDLSYYTYEAASAQDAKPFETVSEKSVVSSVNAFANTSKTGQKSVNGKYFLTEMDLFGRARIDLRLHTYNNATNLNPDFKDNEPIEKVSLSIYKQDDLGVYKPVELNREIDVSKEMDFYADSSTYFNYSYYPTEEGTYKFEFAFVDSNGQLINVWQNSNSSVSFKENIKEVKYTGKYAKADYYIQKTNGNAQRTITIYFDSVNGSYTDYGEAFFNSASPVLTLYTKDDNGTLTPYTTIDLRDIGLMEKTAQQASVLKTQRESDIKSFANNDFEYPNEPKIDESYTYHDDATNDDFSIKVNYLDYSFEKNTDSSGKSSYTANEFVNGWNSNADKTNGTSTRITDPIAAKKAISNYKGIKKYRISVSTNSVKDLYYSVSCDGFSYVDKSLGVTATPQKYNVDVKSLSGYRPEKNVKDEISAETESAFEALSDVNALEFKDGNNILLDLKSVKYSSNNEIHGIITTSNGLPVAYDGATYDTLFEPFTVDNGAATTISLKDHLDQEMLGSLQETLESMCAYGVVIEYYPTNKPVDGYNKVSAWEEDGLESVQDKYTPIRAKYTAANSSVLYKNSPFDYKNVEVLYFGNSSEVTKADTLYNMLSDFSVRHQTADLDGYIVLKVLCSVTTIDVYATDAASKYSVQNSFSANSVVQNPFAKHSTKYSDIPNGFVGLGAVEFKTEMLDSKVSDVNRLSTSQITAKDKADRVGKTFTLDDALSYLNMYSGSTNTAISALTSYNVMADGEYPAETENGVLTDSDGYTYTINTNSAYNVALGDYGKSNFFYVGYKLEENDGSDKDYPKATHPYKMSIRLLSTTEGNTEDDDRRLFGLYATNTRVGANNGNANARYMFTFNNDVQGSRVMQREGTEHYTAEMDLKTYQIKTSIKNGQITDTVTGLRAGSYAKVATAKSVITFTPNPGYSITSVKIDGQEIASGVKGGTSSQLMWTGDAKSGTVSIPSTLTMDHAVDVVCTRTYTITTSITHGTITDTISKIALGENKTIEFEPDNGYYVDSIVLDAGTEQEQKITDIYKYWNGGSYTFFDISADHTIDVVCKAGITVNTYLSKEAYEAAGESTDPINPLKHQVDLLPFAIPDDWIESGKFNPQTITELEMAKMLYGDSADRQTIDDNSWAVANKDIFALSNEQQLQEMGFVMSSGIQENTKVSAYYNKEDFPYVYSYFFPKEVLDMLTASYSTTSKLFIGCGPSGSANLKYQLCYETPDHKTSGGVHKSVVGGVSTNGEEYATYNLGCYVNEKYLPVTIKFQRPNADYSNNTKVVTSFIINNGSDMDFTDSKALETTGGLYAKLYNIETGEYHYEAIQGWRDYYNNKAVGNSSGQFAAKSSVVPANKNNLVYWSAHIPGLEGIERTYVRNGYRLLGIVPYAAIRYVDEESGLFVYSNSGLIDKSLVRLKDLDDTDSTRYEGYNLDGGSGYSYKAPTNNKPYANITSWQEYTCEDGEFTLHTYKARLGFQHNLLKPLASTGAGTAQNPSKSVRGEDSDKYWETKSGYGVETKVTAEITTQSIKDEALPTDSIVNAQSAMAYYPEYGYKSSDGQSGICSALYPEYKSGSKGYFGPYASVRSNGKNTNADPFTFKFLEQKNDGTDRSSHYVPVWYPNETNYALQVKLSDCWTPSGMLSYIGDSNAVQINGSLFDDFKTRETSPW